LAAAQAEQQVKPTKPTALGAAAAAAADDLAAAAKALSEAGNPSINYDTALNRLSEAAPASVRPNDADASIAASGTTHASPPGSGTGGQAGTGSGGSGVSSGEVAQVPKTTWTDFWQGARNQLSSSDQQGQVNQYGDFYRKANKRYLSRIVAESRKKSERERAQ
jgi:hypothetical protein